MLAVTPVMADLVRFVQLNKGEVCGCVAQDMQRSLDHLFIRQTTFAYVGAMGVLQQECRVDGRPVDDAGEVGIGEGLA
ncbi:hypothetical protein D3C76_1037110 [compost metagenome]